MSKGLKEIVYILDRSGSMGGLEADTIGGFIVWYQKRPCCKLCSRRCGNCSVI